MPVQVMMHVGPGGASVADIIERANALGLTADKSWDLGRSRKSGVSAVSVRLGLICGI